ncbi:MAG: hypothetical protein WCJ19_03755 [bacterium]
MFDINRIKNKKGQTLLLVVIVAMVCLTIVIGVVERTNRQLNVQRQNAEYSYALSVSESAIYSLYSLIQSGDINPTNNTTAIDVSSASSFVKSDNSSLTIDPFIAAEDKPYELDLDNSLMVDSLSNVTSSITTFKVWCPYKYFDTNTGSSTSLSNMAMLLQLNYINGSNIVTDNIASLCITDGSFDSGTYDLGSNWKVPASTSSADTSARVSDGSVYTVKNNGDVIINGNSYRVFTYTVPSTRTGYNFDSMVISPKTSLPKVVSGSLQNSDLNGKVNIISKMYNGASIVGTSNPITGAAIGYGKSGRSATIRFAIPNTVQLPSYFNYVMFEGQ